MSPYTKQQCKRKSRKGAPPRDGSEEPVPGTAAYACATPPPFMRRAVICGWELPCDPGMTSLRPWCDVSPPFPSDPGDCRPLETGASIGLCSYTGDENAAAAPHGRCAPDATDAVRLPYPTLLTVGATCSVEPCALPKAALLGQLEVAADVSDAVAVAPVAYR